MTFEVVQEVTNDIQLVNIKFLENIRYKLSINKFCLADIIRPYNKCQYQWLRQPTVQSFMEKHEECFVKTTFTPKHKKEHIFIGYKVIPFVLSWIDLSLGYEFQNDLIRTDKRTDGYIYLVQYPSDITEHVVKVGRTFNIKERYQGKVDVIGIEYVEDMYRSEDILIEESTLSVSRLKKQLNSSMMLLMMTLHKQQGSSSLFFLSVRRVNQY